jgi:hypothetical protein
VRPKLAYFPIADDVAGLEAVIKGRCRDLPDVVKTLFRKFKPYKGGNNAIWTLNKLRQSAHTALAAVDCAGASVWISHTIDSEPLDGLNPVWDSAKQEIQFARGLIGKKRNYTIQPTIVIGFDQIELTGRKPAIAVLNAAFGEVEKIVKTTETLCRRVGLTGTGSSWVQNRSFAFAPPM